MQKPSGGWLGFVLASAWVSACTSSAEVASPGAAGAPTGTSGASASGGTAGEQSAPAGGMAHAGSQHGDAGSGDDAGHSGGVGESGGVGDSGGVQNRFIDQIVLGQAGGPPKCLPRSLGAGLPGRDDDGRVPCAIGELKPSACDCSQPARAPLSASLLSALRQKMRTSGACDTSTTVSCDTLCGCEIVQTPGLASDPGSELHACQNELSPGASVAGFCEIDQMRTDASGAPAPLGNPELVAQCPSNEKRLLRFVGAGEPASEASSFISCSQ